MIFYAALFIVLVLLFSEYSPKLALYLAALVFLSTAIFNAPTFVKLFGGE